MKYLKDSLKLNKMLKDMITNLMSECDRNTIRQLQVIRILNGGNQLQTIIMDTPRGYISFTETCNFYKSLYDIGLKLPLSRQDTDRRLLTGSS